jgi:phosphonate ABC transporter permease subunit PhnE
MNNKNSVPQRPRSQAALRRLLIILGLAVTVALFSYGWTVTNINLTVPQEPVRQTNVGNALRELLSPNVFTQEYEIIDATASVIMNCPADFVAPEVTPVDGPYIVVDPACASSDDTVTIRGYNFFPNALTRVNWMATDGERRIRQVNELGRDNFVSREDGTFEVTINVPRIRGSAGETHTIEVRGLFPDGPPQLSATTGLVIEKMIETIFLALIATSVSILPSAILSFLAAHNLMRPIRIQMGSLLIAIVLLPVGWFIGTLLIGRLGEMMLRIGNLDFSGAESVAATSALIILGATVVVNRRIRSDEPGLPRLVLNRVLIAVGSIVVIGLIGGLGLLAGRTFTTDWPGYFGRFIGSLGQMVELMIVPLAGIITAVIVAGMGIAVTRGAFKTMTPTAGRIAGLVLGGLSGALLLGLMAMIGMSAAWLGLLPPIIAAGLASGLLPQVYRQFVSTDPLRPRGDRFVLMLLGWAGAIVAFILTYNVLHTQRALVEGTLPPTAVVLDLGIVQLSSYVLNAMLIGAVLGAASGFLVGTRSNFGIGSVMYSTTRTILNALRSIEPLIMGLVFVIWVGIGPFAGVLALALHSIASLGKLYSEQIESIDAGPIEALQSTGANRLQTIMYAVVPQIIPPYIAFTMYRWDINVRMSTIIGFVGGGGIGFLLQQQINLLRYRDAGVAVLAIAIVVSILDYASAAIRERYT